MSNLNFLTTVHWQRYYSSHDNALITFYGVCIGSIILLLLLMVAYRTLHKTRMNKIVFRLTIGQVLLSLVWTWSFLSLRIANLFFNTDTPCWFSELPGVFFCEARCVLYCLFVFKIRIAFDASYFELSSKNLCLWTTIATLTMNLSYVFFLLISIEYDNNDDCVNVAAIWAYFPLLAIDNIIAFTILCLFIRQLFKVELILSPPGIADL